MKAGDEFENREEKVNRKPLGWWLLFAGMAGMVFAFCAILYIWLYIQQVQNGYRLAKLFEEHEQLLAVQRKLKLEWCQFQDPYQLEEMGRRHFGLAPPRQDQKLLMR